MNEQESRALLRVHLQHYRRRSHAELAALLDEPQTAALEGPSGTRYQVEVNVFWDRRPGGTLRVIGSIDDGGRRSFKPLCDDFLLAPDGSFVGE